MLQKYGLSRTEILISNIGCPWVRWKELTKCNLIYWAYQKCHIKFYCLPQETPQGLYFVNCSIRICIGINNLKLCQKVRLLALTVRTFLMLKNTQLFLFLFNNFLRWSINIVKFLILLTEFFLLKIRSLLYHLFIYNRFDKIPTSRFLDGCGKLMLDLFRSLLLQ